MAYTKRDGMSVIELLTKYNCCERPPIYKHINDNEWLGFSLTHLTRN